MNNKISHTGVVESIVDGCVRVRILQSSACASCQIAGHCNASDMKVKVVEVNCGDAARSWKVGQPVVVSASRGIANYALLLGFGLPLFMMLVTLVVLSWLHYDEGTVALATLAVLLPYYLVVWLMRNRIRRQVSFQIEEDKTN